MRTFILIIILISSCFKGTVDSDEEKEIEILWIQSTSNIDAPNVPPLTISNSTVVYSGEIELVALEAGNGKESWRATIDGSEALESVVLLYDSKLNRVISNHFKTFKAWNAETGEQIFTLTEQDGILAFSRGRNTLVNDGYGFVGDTLDAYVVNTDGSIRFKIEVDFGTLGVAYGGQEFVIAQGKTITGALTLGKIRAFDSLTGDSLWIFETEKGGFGNSALFVENGIIYAGSFGNSPTSIAVALNAETGEVIWEYESDYIFARNSALGPKNYYVNTGGSLAALSKNNGELQWRVEWLGTASTKPVYLEGYVYFTNYSELMVIDDKTGEVVHREFSLDGSTIWHVAASSDKVFVQTSSQLIAYQPWHLRD